MRVRSYYNVEGETLFYHALLVDHPFFLDFVLESSAKERGQFRDLVEGLAAAHRRCETGRVAALLDERQLAPFFLWMLYADDKHMAAVRAPYGTRPPRARLGTRPLRSLTRMVDATSGGCSI